MVNDPVIQISESVQEIEYKLKQLKSEKSKLLAELTGSMS